MRRGGVSITVEPVADGSRVTVIAPDRVGLLADVAAMFALQRIAGPGGPGLVAGPVRRLGLGGRRGAARRRGAAAALRRDRRRAGSTRRPGWRRPPAQALAPTVVVRPEASAQATVLEVRAADRPGVVYLVCAALARLDVAVRSAHVDTLGPQAVDVFYLQEASAGALSDVRAAEAAHAVREALTG